MPRPKGSKNRTTIARHGGTALAVLEDRIEKLNKEQSTGPAPDLFPNQNPKATMIITESFKTGTWYHYIGPEIIVIDGKVARWSVIKFEVVKTAYKIAAVRFEDGSFEAITDFDFDQFELVARPNY